MKNPTRKEIKDYERNITMNKLFRSVDTTLAADLTPDERVVVMARIWPAVTEVASVVMRRTISDLTGGRR